MASYIILVNLTEQGIRNIKDSAKRAAAATELGRVSAWKFGTSSGRSARSIAKS